MLNAILRPGSFRRSSLALAALVVAGGFATAPAAAEPSRQQRPAAQSAGLLVQVKSHREVRRDHDRAKRPHHRRHIVKRHWKKRDWRRHDHGHRAKRHHWRHHDHGNRAWRHHWYRQHRGHHAGPPRWRRHDNWDRRDWGHEALRRLFR